MPSRRLIAFALTASCAIALAACSSGKAKSNSTQANGSGGGTLNIIETDPAGGLDPAAAFVDSSRVVIAMMFGTLVQRDESGKLVGGLAASWKSNADDTQYVFTVRPGKFSDGSAITAGDVAFSINRMKTSKTIGNALKAISSVTASGDDQVTVQLSQPTRTLPALLSQPGWAVVLPQKQVEANKDFFTNPTVSSGPFELQKYVPSDNMSFKKNPNYYHAAKIDGVKFTFGKDTTANAAAVLSKSVDIAYVNYSDVAKLKSAGLNIYQTDALNLLFFGFNKTKAPFNDVRVRQAFAYADDRDGKQQSCWNGTGAVSYGSLLRPWDTNYTEIDTYKLAKADADAKAADLLDQAGWVKGSDGMRVAQGVPGVKDGTALKVTVPYESNWPAAQCHTLVLQQSLKDVGVSVKPQAYDPTTFYTEAGKGTFAMWHGGAGAQDSDDLYQNWFHTGGALTAISTALSDPQIDAQIDAALRETDPAKVKADYAALEQWQAEQVPMLVDGSQWPQLAVTSRVHGYASGWLDDPWPLTNITLS